MILQGGVSAVGAILQVVGLGILSGLAATVTAAVYRWYVRDRVPIGLPVLVGLAAVAIALNTTAALGQVLIGQADPLSLRTVAFNITAFLVAGLFAPVGRRLGDRLAVNTVAFAGGREVDADVGRLVQAVGRLIAVQLPPAEAIDDVAGYEPATDEQKAAIAGKTLLFPRRLTVAELCEQLRARLMEDYEIGTVDVEVAADGTVEHLGVGRRVTGLGQTLAPDTAAVAVTADPANAAGPGDLVQLWSGPTDASADAERTPSADDEPEPTCQEPDDGGGRPRRVTTAEVRAVAGETVTLAVPEEVAPEVAGGSYRLVTLPFDPPADREFASLLRAADATTTQLTVADGAAVVGQPAATLDATVVAVDPADGPLRFVTDDRPLAAGDTVYVVGTPETIRRVERAVTAAA